MPLSGTFAYETILFFQSLLRGVAQQKGTLNPLARDLNWKRNEERLKAFWEMFPKFRGASFETIATSKLMSTLEEAGLYALLLGNPQNVRINFALCKAICDRERASNERRVFCAIAGIDERSFALNALQLRDEIFAESEEALSVDFLKNAISGSAKSRAS